MPNKFNFVVIEISKDQIKTNKNFIVSIVYRPPNASVVEFIECYQAIPSTVQTENKYMIIMGDYNINTLKCLKTLLEIKIGMNLVMYYLLLAISS